ncbi:phosphoesterase [Chytriomyces sp. MP71]|nr:phosphoesterase [Chytriomyces sp. MP71]
MNGGRMDKYTQGCGSSDKRNYAMADGSVGSASQYWGWASHYAMSDRFFQSAPGASSQGEMFFARGAFVFKDNSFYPATSVGLGKTCPGNCMTYDDPTIGDLLLQCNVPFKFYHVGWPNSNDPTDDAFLYYEKIANGPNAKSIFVEYGQLANDIANGNLPPVSYVKASYSGGVTGGGQTEHPGSKTSISDGENFNAVIINQILSSPLYRDNTVIFLVPDESGGFRDSVTPPPRSDVDNKLYGPRTQFLAVSNLVNKNYVSHVVTEPASLIRFIESNWFADAQPGHLHTRDAVAGSLNDLFDPTLVGFTFP